MKDVLLSGTLDRFAVHIVRQLQVHGYRVRLLAYPAAQYSAAQHASKPDLQRQRAFGGSRIGEKANGYQPIPFATDLRAEYLSPAAWDRQSLCDTIRGSDAVIHLAHRSLRKPRRQRYFYTAEVDANVQLIESCKEVGIRRFVLVSNAHTVGPGSRERPGTEWNEFTLFGAGSASINSKFLTESYVLEQVQKGLPAVVVNPTQVVDNTYWWPLDQHRPLAHLGRSLRWVPPGGSNFIAPTDAAKGVLAALEHGRIGERYLLAGENLTYAAFFRLLDEASGRPPGARFRMPRWSLLLAGQLAELWQVFRREKGPLNAAVGRLLSTERYYSGGKAQQELGVPLTPIREALRDLIHQQAQQEQVF